MTYSFAFSKTSNSNNNDAFPSEGIVLTLDEQTILTTGTVSVPTHGYVPIPLGALDVDFALGLYENDSRIPASVQVMATWGVSDKPRWLHVHFVGKYDNGVARNYILKPESLPDNPPSTNLTTDEDSTTITVDNGYIKFIVSTTAFCGIQQLWYDSTGLGDYGSPLINSTSGGPIFVSDTGGKWLPKNDTLTTVEIEESNEIRVVLKAKGYYQTPTTSAYKQMKFFNRIILYHDLSWIIFQHVDVPMGRLKWTTYTSNTVLVSGGENHYVYDLQYKLPFTGATGYEFGADSNVVSGSLSGVTLSLVDNLVAYWKLDETSGTYYDSVYQNHLTNVGVSSIGGKIGNAANFNRTSTNYLWIPSYNPAFDVGTNDSFAVSMWVHLNEKSTSPTFISKSAQASPSGGFRIGYTSSGDRFIFTCFAGATGTTVSANNLGSPSNSTWYHILAQFNATNGQLSIAINGGTADTATISGTYTKSTAPLVIGTWSNSGTPMSANSTYGANAYIDGVGFWNGRTLTNTEKSALYNSGNGVDYPFGLTLTPAGNDNTAYLHQYRHNELRLLGAATTEDVYSKSDGWAAVTDGTTRIAFLLKYPWQKFPKEFELSNTGITFHAWPQHGITTYTLDEQLLRSNIHKTWCFHQGPYLNSQMPVEYVSMMQVGPGQDCTFDPATDIVTSAYAHGWSTGQRVQLMRANNNSVLPTSSPQVVSNNYIYTGGSGSLYYYYNVTSYYIKSLSSNTFYLYDTATNANVGTTTGRINFTSTGTGPIYIGTTDYQLEATTIENYPPGIYWATMSGLNIENDFALIFSPQSDNLDCNKYQQLFQQKPIARPPANWIEQSQALGPIATADDNFSELEEALEKGVIGWANFERHDDYGQFNFGNTHHQWYSTEQRPSLARCWYSSHYFIIETLWVMYLHSGSKDILDLARKMTNNYASVCTKRAENDSPSTLAFAFMHGKGGNVQWTGDEGRWYHYGDSDGLMYAWLIDADFMAKEAYDDYYASVYSVEFPPINFSETPTYWRDYVAPLKRLCCMLEYTKDARLLPVIHTLGNFAKTVHPNVYNNTGPVWHPLWLNKYYESLRDPDYAEYIPTYVTGEIADRLDSPNTNVGFTPEHVSTIAVAAKTYEITGDSDYLSRYLWWVDAYTRRIADLPGTLYDGYGEQAGPLTVPNGYLWMLWPYVQKQLKNANITALPAPEDAFDYWGSYLLNNSSPFSDPNRSLLVYIKKPIDQRWHFTLHTYSPGDDDHSSAYGIMVYDPVGNQVYHLGSNLVTTYYQPGEGDGYPFNISIDTSNNIISTVSGGNHNDGYSNWTTGQFVQLEAQIIGGEQIDSTATLPTSTPQVELHKTYYVRMLTDYSLKLFLTADNAFDNINPIQFSTTGSNLCLATRGETIDSPNNRILKTNNFYLDADGKTGIYKVYIGGFGGVIQPFTSWPECCVVRNTNSVIYTTKQSYTRGYLVPLKSYPINLTFTAKGKEGIANIYIKDANDNTVVQQSLVPGVNSGGVASSLTVVINNSDGHPTPWFFDMDSGEYWEMEARPVSGQTDLNLFLYGSNLSDILTIKSDLGL